MKAISRNYENCHLHFTTIKTRIMENNSESIESLVERTVEYSKTSFELIKLKALDKSSEVFSSSIPHIVVFFMGASFMLFLNLGLAFWLGEILGKVYYGFIVVAAFYLLIGTSIHFYMHEWLKKIICNYIIKQALK